MNLKELQLLFIAITVISAVILVPSGFNTLKDAISSAESHDNVQLNVGNFTNDEIDLTFPLSIFGA